MALLIGLGLGILLAMIFLAVGLILLIAVPNHMDKVHATCTQPVPARIADVIKEKMSMHPPVRYNYAPVYEYVCNGTVYRIKSVLNSSQPPVIGTQVLLMVDPANPDNCCEPQQQQRAKTIFRIVGGGLLAVGILALPVLGLVLLAVAG